MKPGLWISLTSADTASVVFKAHPEWFIRDAAGKPADLHVENSRRVTACLATGWYDHIKSVILGLVREHGLAYVKLDLTIVTSAYVYDRSRSGCYAHDHPLHRDREESYLVEYERCMSLFDELHREAPNLFIDCTFETWGGLQLIDYALVTHAEGDWLSNIEQPAPYGSLRVRNLAWSRSPAIPAGSMVIGNLTLDDPGRELSFLSLAGTLPIMLGDPRKVSVEDRRKLRTWADWLRAMERKHGYFLFRQDLPGFGEPEEGHWDGWARLNTDTGSGGIFGLFRQGGAESTRGITLSGLDPAEEYIIRRGPGGEKVGQFSGNILREKGLPISIPEPYGAMLFEVERIGKK
jgi:alpha-galactosidase